jgi:hypothetical protein
VFKYFEDNCGYLMIGYAKNFWNSLNKVSFRRLYFFFNELCNILAFIIVPPGITIYIFGYLID